MQFVIFLQPLGHLEPGNLWKLNVHQNQVRAMFSRKIKGFHTVAGLDSRVTRRLDQVTKELHIQLVVFNNHHLLGHFDPLFCGSGLQARRIQISCARMISPVPGNLTLKLFG